jgi:hypothetical protein
VAAAASFSRSRAAADGGTSCHDGARVLWIDRIDPLWWKKQVRKGQDAIGAGSHPLADGETSSRRPPHRPLVRFERRWQQTEI